MGKQAKRDRKETERANSSGEDHSLTEGDKRFASTLNYLARGIIIGGSLGVFAGWIIPGVEMGRMLGLGLLCGCLAGVTMKNINDRKQGR
ncbi:MAG: hypothetical protein HY916_02035 [Desulfovibrio sp.]|jgi:hypothetical protein|nr:hypothetical protein [Desulfovibrio sp.]